MKKLFITLIALFLVFTFAACEILDMPLSAPTEDEITDSSTSSESSKETEQSETELKTETKTEEETYYGGTHVSCEYCGKLDGDRRWFIGKVMENHLIMPLGTNCFEKNAAGDAGIDVWYKKVDGEERRLTAGEYVCIMYSGYIMESYPVQINSDDVSTVDIDFDEGHFEEPTPTIGDYVIVDMDTDRVYLELPISKIKIQIDDDEVEWLNRIDTALLIEADQHLTGGDQSFGGALWLTNEGGIIYLNSEIIVDVDDPGPQYGCFDHEHIFDEYCISK